MTNYLKNALKIGTGYLVAKVAAASNGDESLFSDKNVNNGLIGYIAGVYAIPRARESLDKLVESASNGERPNLKRIAKFAIVGAGAAGLAYAIEKGVHTKLVESASEAYKKVKPEQS